MGKGVLLNGEEVNDKEGFLFCKAPSSPYMEWKPLYTQKPSRKRDWVASPQRVILAAFKTREGLVFLQPDTIRTFDKKPQVKQQMRRRQFKKSRFWPNKRKLRR
ncbi:hypothetical protein MGU_01769 [Metarhizium guizhouense ARSEF 977]|uniref:Uncharacterized protein n=1 Tax=Metarhizium guizhouense (strain ARSEF 977) TaxID=1276136 RepID=A0A0B4IBS6_METGA|nr:hypothetical protein MGU_01769 [Metarhizium guizhouense ARSEF 977]